MMGNCIHFLAISWTRPAPADFRACDLSTYPATPASGATEAPGMSPRPIRSVCFEGSPRRQAADAGPRHLHATHISVCADFGLGRVAARGAAQGYRF